MALALCALGIGAVAASADPPQVTTPQVSNIPSGTPHVEGEVDPNGISSEWWFEVSTDGITWDRTSVEGFAGGSGFQQVEGDITSLNYGSGSLHAGTTYRIRLSALNYVGDPQASSPEAEFTTESVNAPTVSIDPVTDATSTTATFSGEIDPNPPAGNPGAADVKWHFECTPECPGLQGGTVAAGAEGSAREVEAEATGLEPNTTYEVTLVAKNTGDPVSSAPVSFTTVAVGPEAETIPAFALGDGTSALVGGRVNPRNSATTYWIEWGPTAAYGNSAPASQDGDAGSGGAFVFRTERIGGLTPGTTYHFRFVAKNVASTEAGEDMTFETPSPAPQECANSVLRSENNSGALPDCRAYEMVSPPNKNGYDAGLNTDNPETDVKPAFIAAADGEAFAFETYGALPGAQSSKVLNENLSTRGAGGWSTRSIDPPAPANEFNTSSHFSYFNPNLDHAVVGTPPGLELGPGGSPGVSNLYARDNRSGTYSVLTGPPLSGPNRGEPTYWGSSIDFSHVMFLSPDVLTPGALQPVPNGTGVIGANIYERADGELRLASILPNGEAALTEGITDNPVAHTVSEDGSRIVFVTPFLDPAVDGQQIYVREDGVKTVQVSKSQRAIPDPSFTVAQLYGFSADGSTVVFSSNKALTDDAEPGRPALYRFDVEGGTLENLMAGLNVALPPAGVVGMSEDNSYVYFRTQDGDIYLSHDGKDHLIATAGDIQCCSRGSIVPRVSPNGRFLVFATSVRLTAYDNTDAASGQPDKEVYRFDAATGRLICASCRPSGEAPTGSSSLPSPPEFQKENQQRSVINDGTVFFDSRDALLPADSNGLGDAYEMRDGRVALLSSGTSGDASGFAGVSLDGRDAFIVTRQRLVPFDTDSNRDVYDARIGGGFRVPEEEARGCGGDECQGQASVPPPAASPASSHLRNPFARQRREHKKHHKHRRCRGLKGAKGKNHRPKHCKGRMTKANQGGSR